MTANEILAAAKSRMDAAPYSPYTVYAEVLFMTSAELVAFFDLVRAERIREVLEARQRIADKVK